MNMNIVARALPFLIVGWEATACPHMRRLRRGDGNRDASSSSSKRPHASGGVREEHFYGRFFDEAEVPPFASIVHDAIEATKPAPNPNPDGERRYMDEGSRTTGGRDGGNLLNATGDEIVPNINVRDGTGPAGYSYLGQLLSHDMNQDRTSELVRPVDPSIVPNLNTPFLDLDTVYSFHGNDADIQRGKFVMGTSASGLEIDFPRNDDGSARIADERNDNTKILAQIQAQFMLLHNKYVDEFQSGYGNDDDVDSHRAFSHAKAETLRTWQSVVIFDLLPNLIDQSVLDMVAADGYVNKLYAGDVADRNGMPVEFSAGAYRLFHSRPQSGYRLRATVAGARADRLPLLPQDSITERSLFGGERLRQGEMIDFQCFFNSTAACAQRGRMLDPLYATPLLKMAIGGPGVPPTFMAIFDPATSLRTMLEGPAYQRPLDATHVSDLATADLLRAVTLGVPGGIALANKTKSLWSNITVYEVDDMLASPFGLPDEYSTVMNAPQDVPLVLYCAHEALAEHDGMRMGKLCSLIVAETVVTLCKKTTPTILDTANPWISTLTGSGVVTFLDVVGYIGWNWTLDENMN